MIALSKTAKFFFSVFFFFEKVLDQNCCIGSIRNNAVITEKLICEILRNCLFALNNYRRDCNFAPIRL